MSLMPPIRGQNVDDDPTIDDAPSLSEDMGHYDSHGDTDDEAFPELDFSRQNSRADVTPQLSNQKFNTIVTGVVNTSTPVDNQVLPGQQEYHLPTYDEVIRMDSSSSATPHYYPGESRVTYRHKNTT